MNNKNNFLLGFVQCRFLFPKQLPTGTLLSCSLLILNMAKNQSDVENLVKNCLIALFIYLFIIIIIIIIEG